MHFFFQMDQFQLLKFIFFFCIFAQLIWFGLRRAIARNGEELTVQSRRGCDGQRRARKAAAACSLGWAATGNCKQRRRAYRAV
jgi:hypothetical protein